MSVLFFPLLSSNSRRTNLKALYTGRYQQTKEHGVKRRAQRMARPSPTPLDDGSIQNIAREEIRLRSSVPALTETDRSAKTRLVRVVGDWGGVFVPALSCSGDCGTVSAARDPGSRVSVFAQTLEPDVQTESIKRRDSTPTFSFESLEVFRVLK